MSRESLRSLARLTGFAVDTVRARVSKLIPIQGDNRAHLYESREALPLIYARDNEEFNADAERARLLHHQANNESLKERQLVGELIPAGEVREELGKAFSNVRAHLLTLPQQLSARCGYSDPADVKREAKRLVNSALDELTTKHFE